MWNQANIQGPFKKYLASTSILTGTTTVVLAANLQAVLLWFLKTTFMIFVASSYCVELSILHIFL